MLEPKDLLQEYDKIFLKRCEDRGLNYADSVGELLSDPTRKDILQGMVHAEATKTQIVITVQPGNPILEQMFINQAQEKK